MKPHNMNQQTARTKSHLKQAFISLVSQKGYQHVTVTDIVDSAQYNRTTFYHYYLDKEDLADELRKEMFEAIINMSINKYSVGTVIKTEELNAHSYDLIYFIKNNQAYFNLLLVSDTVPGIHHDLPDAIYEVLEKQFEFTSENSDAANTAAYKKYMAHGTAGLITEWIRNDYDLSPEALSLQFIKILQTMVKGFVIRKV
ncbi:TetR/AcrR family transcriptional regulator [Jeotgalibacillus terrae]|uniref:TetR/AcrR family transcriptional regulator n=1 Tax=Jeotgalibacillus terrae TaxID=587735 RepID=A0ABW5ZLK3_9BACL|nr:TetR/AcrR family transcriptional regulator [Jeotgalibacillus terrae]MBM7578087.1 AcrR family transcriptional regulator [Jeotgalibacillus terrae]